MCQEFDFEYFRTAKLTRLGVHNPGFNHWQLFLCPEDMYQNIASRIRQNNSSLSLHHPFIMPYNRQDRRHSSLFLDAMRDRREGSFVWLENSLRKAVELGQNSLSLTSTTVRGLVIWQQPENSQAMQWTDLPNYHAHSRYRFTWSSSVTIQYSTILRSL